MRTIRVTLITLAAVVVLASASRLTAHGRFGMPALPAMPGVPAVPGLPAMPALAAMPGLPAVPMLPAMAAMPIVPAVPADWPSGVVLASWSALAHGSVEALMDVWRPGHHRGGRLDVAFLAPDMAPLQAPADPAPEAGQTAPAAPTAPAVTPDTAPEPAADQTPDTPRVTVRSFERPAVRVFQDYELAAGDRVREVVVVSGSARIAGEVTGDMAIVLGDVTLAPTAVINGDVAVVGGEITVEPGAVVRRDLAVVGSRFTAPPEFNAGGEQVVVGPAIVGERVRAMVPWVTTGLLWGRLVVPSLTISWIVVAISFFVYLVLNLVFDRPVRAVARIIGDKPLSAFLVGLLVLLLVGPVAFILAASVVGVPVIPFLLCALLIAGVLGKIATMRWIGSSMVAEDAEDDRRQGLRSFAIGFTVITLLYMVPILGLVCFATLGLFAIGGASMAFLGALRRENPAPEPPPVPPPPPAPSPSSPSYGAGAAASEGPAADYFVSEPPPAGGEPAGGAGWPAAEPPPPPAPPPPPPPPPSAPVAGSLLGMPHARFLDRFAAFALDVILVALFYNIFDIRLFRDGTNTFFLMLLVYHVAFWTYRATTVGGIICNLRVTRTDGTPLRFGDAAVRGLSSIFSLFVLGLGCFWILWDPERQSWHDRIAGTYVVKVPRNYQAPDASRR